MLAHALAPILARRGIHYGWAMAAVTFLVALSTSAAMGMPGVLMLPLQHEFGWDLGSISGAMALRLAAVRADGAVRRGADAALRGEAHGGRRARC